ncbi:hypothetical protein AGABI1DRAFT_121236 [Agaricus bisporus var. burnettii JB137-S8]|uniref:Decapping nuclease n=1 Tax=Agaricus bisporus var. burnettii (strain JB137-S8 / ATCC MYA-4627 / FGSC 10392) TaxID=597362 RepID=K5X788_AGABU|nr:uncharacterized protein AGABI1DRAFT_121236 [Agaricus bisporus var. burnettii JB137-S8]EKM78837.1 hypothetical protein AGABI1DRAFT_121236 [Agaricus bisporus var. burnettii JB137-S8]
MNLKRGREDSHHSEEAKRAKTEPSTPGKEPPRGANITRPLPRNVVPTPFQQPTQLATFSYTPDRELVFDNSAMKYYVEPPRGVKLNYGYDQWIKQEEERGRIDNLLKALSRVRSDPTRHTAVKELGVVSWRGVMTKILTAPYEERDGWELNVMNVDGTLYFEEYVSEARAVEKQNMNPRQSMQTYYGYAFESYCTADTPRRPAPDPACRDPFGWSGDVNNNVQWCSVVRTKLGNTRIFIGGEVDCEIVVGFRTPAGVVSTIQSFKTVEIPRMVRGKASAWDPLVCLDWAGRFLTYVRQRMASEEKTSSGPKVWRVWFMPGSGIRLRELNATEVVDVEHGEDRIGFLPRWYWTELGQGR